MTSPGSHSRKTFVERVSSSRTGKYLSAIKPARCFRVSPGATGAWTKTVAWGEKSGRKKGKPMMWSRWKWVKRRWIRTGPFPASSASAMMRSPRALIPVPESTTMYSPAAVRNERQQVWPP